MSQITKWMMMEDPQDYVLNGEYNCTLLGQTASSHFGFEPGSDDDELCFEESFNVITNYWEKENHAVQTCKIVTGKLREPAQKPEGTPES